MKLLLTLGHNASAILVRGTEVINGYEEERLSKVKSDSSFPKLAINQLLHYNPEAVFEVDEICVSHWFDLTGEELRQTNKYWEPEYIKARFPKAAITSLSKSFTHHDAHAKALWNFSETKDGLTIVADGFGSNQETVSLYHNGELHKRFHDISLGLLYQYTTSYLGLKEHQDEYKLLGYEAHVEAEVAAKLDMFAEIYAEEWYTDIAHKHQSYNSIETMTKMNRAKVNAMHNFVFSYIEKTRTNVAYFVQNIVERVVLTLISEHMPKDCKTIQCTGGVFYNVKLNNAILNAYDMDLIEFMPLAGDQGNGLGFIEGIKIDNLFWGKRDLCKDMEYKRVEDFAFIFKGNMEFGPRALGNTSCIALPTLASVARINEINKRSTVMPMAPMIHPNLAATYCKNIERLGKCKHYMIVATDWNGSVEEFRGVLHNKPLGGGYTCRPQVVDNMFTRKLGVVINTSLNAHGQPILFDETDYAIMKAIHSN